MTIATDNVARFAAADRHQRADQLLVSACRDAAQMFRLGRRYDDERAAMRDAVHMLTAAGSSAARILGPHQTAAAPTSTPGAAARPDAHRGGEALGRPATHTTQETR